MYHFLYNNKNKERGTCQLNGGQYLYSFQWHATNMELLQNIGVANPFNLIDIYFYNSTNL